MIRNKRYRLNESAVSETLDKSRYYSILGKAFDNANIPTRLSESYVDYDTVIMYDEEDSEYAWTSTYYSCRLVLYKFDDSGYLGEEPKKGDTVVGVDGGRIDVGMEIEDDDGHVLVEPDYNYNFSSSDLPDNIKFMGHFTGAIIPFINVTGMSDIELEKALTEFIEGLFNKKVIKELHRINNEVAEEGLHDYVKSSS